MTSIHPAKPRVRHPDQACSQQRQKLCDYPPRRLARHFWMAPTFAYPPMSLCILMTPPGWMSANCMRTTLPMSSRPTTCHTQHTNTSRGHDQSQSTQLGMYCAQNSATDTSQHRASIKVQSICCEHRPLMAVQCRAAAMTKGCGSLISKRVSQICHAEQIKIPMHPDLACSVPMNSHRACIWSDAYISWFCALARRVSTAWIE